MKMGTYVIQTDFTVEEAVSVVKRIWETIISGEYDDEKMKDFVDENIKTIVSMVKVATSTEGYSLVGLLEDLVYCKRRLDI